MFSMRAHRKLAASTALVTPAIASLKLCWRRTAFISGDSFSTPPTSLSRLTSQEQPGSLFAVRGARSRFGCNDSNCCANGPEDMMENPHVHFITQRSRQLTDLSNVPELRRAEHLLLRHLDTAVRTSRLASRLHPDDQALVKAMLASKKRLVNLRDTLGDLHATDSSATRSSAPMFRGNFKNLSSAAGGQRR